jgi:hypothetical protein
MKKSQLLLICLGIISIWGCKKHHSDVIPAIPVSNPITKDTLSGFIKGTMLSGKTYYIKNDIYVKSTDTLAVQPGVNVVVIGNTNTTPPQTPTIHISGTLLCMGTKDQQINFKPSDPNPTWPTGYWGGIHCDSAAKVVTMTWTNISYTGGPDVSGGSQYAVSVIGVAPSGNNGNFTSNTKVIIENCSFVSGIDDCLRLMGPITVSIKGNVIKHEGSSDGDNINIKTGVMGDVCYNYIWSAANNSIKLETSIVVLIPKTTVNVYNNTIISGGWRKLGETTSGILVDAFASASVYNNLIVNTQRGLRITSVSDTTTIKGHFGNNLFYTTVDSTRKYYYPPTDWGKPQASDILSTGINNNNPMLVAFDANYDAMDDHNNAHLMAGSPALGKGNMNAPSFSNLGTHMAPGKDIGCYQMDGSGNQR